MHRNTRTRPQRYSTCVPWKATQMSSLPKITLPKNFNHSCTKYLWTTCNSQTRATYEKHENLRKYFGNSKTTNNTAPYEIRKQKNSTTKNVLSVLWWPGAGCLVVPTVGGGDGGLTTLQARARTHSIAVPSRIAHSMTIFRAQNPSD